MQNKEQEQASVPYFIHEGQMARMERIIRILAIILAALMIVTVGLFIVNNVIWMRYTDAQVQLVRTEVSNDGVHQQPDQDLNLGEGA
ncbi:MAG: hypothetical protein IK099_06855 [Clostridia bacterium]|nr:hypothetical protein [Clostridia bacterium]